MWTLLLLWLSSLHMYVPQFSFHTAEFGEENVVNESFTYTMRRKPISYLVHTYNECDSCY